MRKHEKQVRRKRRKAERRRPIRNGGAALAAAAAIAAGTSAYADPIRYDNPAGEGHFDWAQGEGRFALDFTLEASQQSGDLFVPTSLAHQVYPSLGFGAVDGFNSGAELQFTSVYLLQGLDYGDAIPSGGGWYGVGYTLSPYYGSDLPEGLTRYFGVRFDVGSGWQYGWVGGIRTGLQFDALAWGYETQPGVPIAAGAPEPGSLALLAMGTVGAMSRRRRA
jgi:hypothetical protein